MVYALPIVAIGVAWFLMRIIIRCQDAGPQARNVEDEWKKTAT